MAITWTELVGSLTGLVCVYLVARASIWNWPLGIANTLLYTVVFLRARLYGDALLQVVFAVLNGYGWWSWTPPGRARRRAAGAARDTRGARARRRRVAGRDRGAALVLARHTDSPVPLWDASVLVLSLVATWGQARKWLESWWLWILVDVISVPLYVSRQLYPTALLYALFLGLCAHGSARVEPAPARAAPRRERRVSEPRHGLVSGRFDPPHAGHHLLIRTAARACARVTVRVLGSAADRIPVERRLAWLREIHAAEPNVAVQSAAEPEPRDVDAVFGPRHISVDPRRELVPVSSRAVRADPIAHWERLAPPVRAWLARRVVIGGAESTGKTTFARDLRDALAARGGAFAETRWVPELGRDYTIDMLALERAPRRAGAASPSPAWTRWSGARADFVAIARGQNALEEVEARRGGPVLVCDTDAFATAIWHERYLGRRAPEVEALADPRPSLYLLTHRDDVRFEPDGVRDGEHLRAWMTDTFVERLRASPHRPRFVRGSRAERVAQACGRRRWLAKARARDPPAGVGWLRGRMSDGRRQAPTRFLGRDRAADRRRRPSRAPAAPTEQIYTVVAGDSLSKIAKRLYGDANQWRRIFEANRDQIQNPDLIKPGQKLKIPAANA